MIRIGIELNGIVRDINNQIVKYYKKDIDKAFDDEMLDKNVVNIINSLNFESMKKTNEFLYVDYPYEIYGCAKTCERNLSTLINNWMLKFENTEYDDFELVFFSCDENGLTIQSTYYFLSKIGSRVREMYFPKDSKNMWDVCDVIITTRERIVREKPEGKVSVLIVKNDNMNLVELVDKSYEKLSDVINDEEFLPSLVNNTEVLDDDEFEAEKTQTLTMVPENQHVVDKNAKVKIDIISSDGNCSASAEGANAEINIPDAKLWSVDEPNLYTAKVSLVDKGGQILDEKSLRFGFRSAEFKNDGFYLNGEKMKLRGINRHQSYAYVGYAMPKSMQYLDAEILKNELCVNAVRTSHYPQSQHFIDRCDELGILVFTEIPGWQHIGNDEWKKQAVQNTREMVEQYMHHPSIVLWGVRINESQDCDELYEETNKIARSIDPSRQTSGVRYMEKSHLLEDVYAFNDFSHCGDNAGLKSKKNVTSKKNKPYLVSECNGHMFPTKAFDDERHRLSHALRHVAVLNSMYAADDICGIFPWCMFDYNTHKDFGSGDMVCYHGVTDMFRNPKLAAAVFASQGESSPVCEVSSSMDIGEHPAGDIGSVYVFTNADSVKLYKNGLFVKEFFPDRRTYPSLPHPPVVIDDFIGELLESEEHFDDKTAATVRECLNALAKFGLSNIPAKIYAKFGYLMLTKGFRISDAYELYGKYVGNWGGEATVWRFDAVKNGETVKSVTKKPGAKPHIEISADRTNLLDGDTYDVAAIRIRALDEFGNTLPYYQEPVVLKTEGDIEIIGPNVISLKGGMGGTYVKTKGVSGKASLLVGTEEIKFKITAE